MCDKFVDSVQQQKTKLAKTSEKLAQLSEDINDIDQKVAELDQSHGYVFHTVYNSPVMWFK